MPMRSCTVIVTPAFAGLAVQAQCLLSAASQNMKMALLLAEGHLLWLKIFAGARFDDLSATIAGRSIPSPKFQNPPRFRLTSSRLISVNKAENRGFVSSLTGASGRPFCFQSLRVFTEPSAALSQPFFNCFRMFSIQTLRGVFNRNRTDRSHGCQGHSRDPALRHRRNCGAKSMNSLILPCCSSGGHALQVVEIALVHRQDRVEIIGVAAGSFTGAQLRQVVAARRSCTLGALIRCFAYVVAVCVPAESASTLSPRPVI